MAYDRTAMLKLLRPAMTRILTPLGRALVGRGIGPNAVTAVGTLGTVVSALLFFPWGTSPGGTRDHRLRAVRPARRRGGPARREGGSTWGPSSTPRSTGSPTPPSSPA
ncbi:hypothetical protein ACFQ0B_34110 [Nonomuraea thailandensis]